MPYLGVRDHDTGAAYPLLFSGGSPRYPARVALEGGCLWFGEAAEARRDRATLIWDSLKARAGAGSFWEEGAVDGLRLQDLVTLSLTHLLALARVAIRSLAARSMSEPCIRATVGVPTRELQQAHGRYLDCTLAAIQRALVEDVDPQGCSIVELRALLDRVAPKVEHLRGKAREEWDVFLRPEPLSAILWLHRLPQVGEGPYCLVDVGAATVHASFFRIHHVHDPDGRMIEKGGAALFGAESGLCGMDTIGRRLSELGLAPSHVAARGQEARLLAPRGVLKSLEPQLAAMRNVWREADRAARNLIMCTSDRELLQWIVVGGGSRVEPIRDLFSEPPEFLGRIVTKQRPLEGSTRPSDLLAFPALAQRWPVAYTDYAEFLMVAYGCSLPRDAVPEMSLPYDQRPVSITRPKRHTPSYEDLGFG